MTVVLVTAGGALGVLLRYGISSAFHGPALPWATVAINVAGSFLLGVLTTLPRTAMSPELRIALGVGFLGGLTTFSTFSVQAVLDAKAGEPLQGLLYIGISVIGGIAAAVLGYALGRVAH